MDFSELSTADVIIVGSVNDSPSKPIEEAIEKFKSVTGKLLYVRNS